MSEEKKWVVTKSNYRNKDNWRERWAIATGVARKPKPVKVHPDKRKKKVMGKVLYKMGWGSKQIGLWLKTGQQNVVNWSRRETPAEMQEFEEHFTAAMRDYDNESLAKVKVRMNEIIPEEENLEKLIKAGEFFRGDKLLVKNQTNTQVNVYGDLLKKYGNAAEITKLVEKENDGNPGNR